ncbi:hypothetical protein GT022_17850 [Agaribacter marinus]|uniref:Uncharacterized protein n=1 Tax=Virgibacillus salarius TaxID=447199 RepID=A0A941ID01_9BACI|nr:hypothetical protein [Virgibacillus salarius]MBR7797897.1 hypothetical protein [Virgibacillus salarius]NAZ10607.1 hypothetical protein [Agaribacter marinus]
MSLIRAVVHIKGIRPLLFNNFTIDSIPLIKKEKAGVAGNNPEEWKKTYQVTSDGQLYLNPDYIFSCIRAGARHTPKGRGTMESVVSASLQVLDDKILLNRFVTNEDALTNDNSKEVYIDVRPVSRRGVKNIRYRLATSIGWETKFVIMWENTLINRQQMEAFCLDAGAFAGLGDGRKIGYGRFEVVSFKILEEKLNA